MTELIEAVEDLNEGKVIQLVNKKLSEGIDPQLIYQMLETGMKKVGEKYEKGIYFIADLIMAGIILKEALSIEGMQAKPRFNISHEEKMGKILLGTVKGDLHDIGKNIFKDIALANGFEVVDLGVDVPEESFVQKAKSCKPQIIGMSIVLTSAIDSIKTTVEALEEAGLRKNSKILVGGLAINDEIFKYTRADGFANTSTKGIAMCITWKENRYK